MNEASFKINREYDGPLLWDYIRRRVNPTTTVGASSFKEQLENKTLADFLGDIVKYNTWFQDMRDEIIKEEGSDRYDEYLRNLFKAYLNCPDAEFVDTIKFEKRKWTQGIQKEEYSFRDLLELGRLTYNNLVQDGTWKGDIKSAIKPKRTECTDEPVEQNKFLALLGESMKNNGGSNGSKNDGESNLKQFQSWRFENPEDKREKIVRGSIMNWCTNDCHPRPMWCDRKSCLNKADFSAMMKQRREGKRKEKPDENFSQDFKIALQAITTAEDFKMISKQFLQGN